MEIKIISVIFVAAILSSSGYGLAAQPTEFMNIPFAEPATMELGNNDLIKTYVTPQTQTLLSLRESGHPFSQGKCLEIWH